MTLCPQFHSPYATFHLIGLLFYQINILYCLTWFVAYKVFQIKIRRDYKQTKLLENLTQEPKETRSLFYEEWGQRYISDVTN